MKHILYLLIVLQPHLSRAQLGSLVEKEIDSVLSVTYAGSGLPGVVVGYTLEDGQTMAIAKGYADIEKGIQMTDDHLLHGGSTGKTFVSAITMQLLSEGVFALDDPIADYLGSYSWYNRLPNSGTIRIRHLMQHTSGIQRYEFKETFTKALIADKDKLWSPEELVSFVLDDDPLFSAGEGFSYADTNYILLAMIIEEATKRDYYDLLEERILTNINFDSFETTDQPKIPNMAQGYVGGNDPLGFDSLFLDNEGYPSNNMQFEWTGGGLVYKTKDYSKWLKYLYEGNAFDLTQWEEEYFNGVEATGVGGKYGLGVQIYDLPGTGRVYGHSGFFPGYFTLGFYHPDSGRAIAMQLNSSQVEHIRPFYGAFMQMTRILSQAR